MSLFGGVDGGGTHTRAVIVDAQGRELGRAAVPGVVASARAPEAVADSVARAIGEAMEFAALEVLTRDAGLGEIGLPLTGLWAGLAGAGSSETARAVTGELSRRGLANRIHVGTDVEAAYRDAFPHERGILLIAGTGSIAWSTDPSGRSVRVGGWGRQLGDEGSGFWIGMEAIRHAMRAADGRATAGPLDRMVVEHARVDAPEGLVGWTAEADKASIAALAPGIVALASGGDAAAASIVDTAVTELTAMVEALAPSSSSSGLPVVLWGGLVADGGPLRDRLVERLEAAGHRVEERPVDPPLGAARLALEL